MKVKVSVSRRDSAFIIVIIIFIVIIGFVCVIIFIW